MEKSFLGKFFKNFSNNFERKFGNWVNNWQKINIQKYRFGGENLRKIGANHSPHSSHHFSPKWQINFWDKSLLCQAICEITACNRTFMIQKIKIGFRGKLEKKTPFFPVFHISKKSCFTKDFGRNPVRRVTRKMMSEQKILHIIIFSFSIFCLCNRISVFIHAFCHYPLLWIFFNVLSHFRQRVFWQKIIIIQKNNIILKILILIFHHPINRTISRKIHSLIRVVFEKFLARIFANWLQKIPRIRCFGIINHKM